MLEEVTSDIKSISSSLKKGLGKNGYALLLAGGAVVALIIILRSNKDDETEDYTVPTGVASYPDVGENADVIISSIGSSIDYAQDEIIDSIGETIKGSKDDIIENDNNNTDTILDTIKNTNPMYTDISSSDGGTSYQTPKEFISYKTDVTPADSMAMASTIAGALSGLPFGVTTAISNGKTQGKSVNSALANDTMSAVKKKSNTNPKTGKKTATKTNAHNSKSTTIKKTNYKGNSIVDGLKSVGVNSSYDNRKKLAQANGIKNYTGTASQNTKLLNSLKSGTLKTGNSGSHKNSTSPKNSSGSHKNSGGSNKNSGGSNKSSKKKK